MNNLNKEVSDPFWYDNFEILYRKDRLIEFFPSWQHSKTEKLNSFVRLAFYISFILMTYKRNYRYIFIVVGVLLFTAMIYNKQQEKQEKEQHNEKEEFSDLDCTKPTLDNPFMNATMKDYLNIRDGKTVDRPPACNINDPLVKKQVDTMFNNNLYRDIDDVFGKMNSQRQFFTMPYTTIPNDRDSFQNWLYRSPQTCKEDNSYCLRYEDIRAKQPVFYNPEQNPVGN